MKHIIILGDGMADWKVPALGDKTLLQYAHTPNMDWIARMGRNGLLQTVPDFIPVAKWPILPFWVTISTRCMKDAGRSKRPVSESNWPMTIWRCVVI